jgi:hypothetical protein
MSESNMPPYIERDDNQALVTPAMLGDATLYMFPVPCGISNQQAICDKFLNDPAGNVTDYRAFMPHVYLVMGRYGAVRSEGMIDQNRGFFRVRECCVWIPTVAVKQVALVPVATHFAIFPYYMFVDESHAMVAGRELQGWPKEIGRFHVPADPAQARKLWMQTSVLDEFSPSTRGRRRTLFRLTRTSEDEPSVISSLLSEGKEAARALLDLLVGSGQGIAPSPTLPLSLFSPPQAGVRFVFLKQFRDAARPSQACYQACIEASTKITCLREVGTLPTFELFIRRAASHPVVTELGIEGVDTPEGTTVSDLNGYYARLDFRLDHGKEMWRLP